MDALEKGYRQVYIGPFKHPRPSDQTDLKGQRRCDPRGGREPT
jgi:hypothetical protein